jgi:hypothetical protein
MGHQVVPCPSCSKTRFREDICSFRRHSCCRNSRLLPAVPLAARRRQRMASSPCSIEPSGVRVAAYAASISSRPDLRGLRRRLHRSRDSVVMVRRWNTPNNLGLAWRRTDIERYGRHRLSASIARAKPRQERRRHLVDACRAYGASATRSGAWTLVRTKAARQSTRVNLPPHRTSRLRLNGPTVTLAVRDFRSWK